MRAPALKERILLNRERRGRINNRHVIHYKRRLSSSEEKERDEEDGAALGVKAALIERVGVSRPLEVRERLQPT